MHPIEGQPGDFFRKFGNRKWNFRCMKEYMYYLKARQYYQSEITFQILGINYF